MPRCETARAPRSGNHRVNVLASNKRLRIAKPDWRSRFPAITLEPCVDGDAQSVPQRSGLRILHYLFRVGREKQELVSSVFHRIQNNATKSSRLDTTDLARYGMSDLPKGPSSSSQCVSHVPERCQGCLRSMHQAKVCGTTRVPPASP